jgi:septal ring factor EnvC (AmiA/AmiB activator)
MIRLAMLAVLVWAGTASAQSETAAAALAAKARLETATALLDGAMESSDQIAALTETVRAYEDGLIAMRDGLRRVAIQQQALQSALDDKSDEVAQLLGVLQMMDPETAPLLLLHPSGALGTARAGMILSDITPAIQSQADDLRVRLAELAELRAVRDSASEVLAQGLDGAQEARSRLAEAISNRTDLPLRYAEDPVATSLLVASAETLAAFAEGLAETAPDDLAPIGSDALARKGSLALPVQGIVLRLAGEADAAGVIRPGIVIAARPRALVTAPVTATIRFRGPLLDYGNVIILEPAPDVLMVLAGLADVFGETGQVIPEGAPVGLMGGELPDVDAILTETALSGGGAQSETLYLEVRDGQGPVDPADWFALE